jgi:hypothetical protein
VFWRGGVKNIGITDKVYFKKSLKSLRKKAVPVYRKSGFLKTLFTHLYRAMLPKALPPETRQLKSKSVGSMATFIGLEILNFA